jgi:hypothetical protein
VNAPNLRVPRDTSRRNSRLVVSLAIELTSAERGALLALQHQVRRLRSTLIDFVNAMGQCGFAATFLYRQTHPCEHARLRKRELFNNSEKQGRAAILHHSRMASSPYHASGISLEHSFVLSDFPLLAHGNFSRHVFYYRL